MMRRHGYRLLWMLVATPAAHIGLVRASGRVVRVTASVRVGFRIGSEGGRHTGVWGLPENLILKSVQAEDPLSVPLHTQYMNCNTRDYLSLNYLSVSRKSKESLRRQAWISDIISWRIVCQYCVSMCWCLRICAYLSTGR